MLGTEPTIVAEYVETGRIQYIFWPVINHGLPSVYATVTMQCVGEQEAEWAFVAHQRLFENLDQLYGATRDYFIDTAVSIGANREQFVACYDNPATVEQVMALDAIRQERGVVNQPVFQLNEQFVFGAPSLAQFRAALDGALEAVAE